MTYSERWIGASTNCSARVKTDSTAEPAAERMTVLPPKSTWSTTVLVKPTAVSVIPRATRNWKTQEQADSARKRRTHT